MEMQIRTEGQIMRSMPVVPEPQVSSQPSEPTPVRRPANTNTGSLDFLKMAKGIKKK
jgi:hypothetical protein